MLPSLDINSGPLDLIVDGCLSEDILFVQRVLVRKVSCFQHDNNKRTNLLAHGGLIEGLGRPSVELIDSGPERRMVGSGRIRGHSRQTRTRNR